MCRCCVCQTWQDNWSPSAGGGLEVFWKGRSKRCLTQDEMLTLGVRAAVELHHTGSGKTSCLHMAKFMGDGECSAESIVLADTAAPVGIAHRPQLRKSFKQKKETFKFSFNNTFQNDCSIANHFGAATYLRCHTYPWLCRCLVCGAETNNGSKWNTQKEHSSPKPNQSLPIERNYYYDIFVMGYLVANKYMLCICVLARHFFCTWWWGWPCRDGSGGYRPGYSGSVAKCRSSLKWSVHWMKWPDRPEKTKRCNWI